MDTTSVSYHLLGGMAFNQFMAFLLIGWLGIALGMVHEIVNGNKTIKESGGFSFPVWFTNNKWRLLMSLIGVVVLLILPQVFGYSLESLSNKEVFLAGFLSDKFIQLTKLIKR